jgi:hypothetical protein
MWNLKLLRKKKCKELRLSVWTNKNTVSFSVLGVTSGGITEDLLFMASTVVQRRDYTIPFREFRTIYSCRQNGSDDLYVIWICNTVLRLLVRKMDSTFNCSILRVSSFIRFGLRNCEVYYLLEVCSYCACYQNIK